jgi:acetyl-CoA carboxylase biotin carboxyl carrier protein
MKSMDLSLLDELLRVVTAADLSQAEVRCGDAVVRVSRNRTGEIRLHSSPALEMVQEDRHAPAPAIRAHMVGYFRAKDKAIKIGDRISEGDVVGSIESLGLQNEIRAKASGTVEESLAETGSPMEYGQAIYLLTSEVA